MMNPWHFEPVAIGAAIRAVILAGVAFGLDWTPEQIAAVMFAVEAVLVIFTRGSVTTPATIHQAGLTVVGIRQEALARKADAAAAAMRTR